MKLAWCAVVVSGLASIAWQSAGSAVGDSTRFEPAVRLEAAGKLIDVDVGHAAPYVYDWDEDGTRDLLVGQFGSGKLRIYLNEGTEDAPVYGEPQWFTAGGSIATVPAG